MYSDLHGNLDFHNWICDSDNVKNALQGILDSNEHASGNEKTHIGRLAPVFDLMGNQILPEQFPSLRGAVVEIGATISNEVMNSNKAKFDNFYADFVRT